MTGLKPFFTYYGGKWRAAPHYPAPRFAEIVEPFAGAAGYSLRYPDRQVILVEKDPTIAALWRYLTRVSAAEVRALPLIAHDQTVNDLRVHCEEARHLIGFWLNKGTTGPCIRPSKWMRDGTRPKSYWGKEIRERIAAQVDRIRHWYVHEGDYASIPNAPATWFVDPPYQMQGRYYRCSATAIDFAHLAQWCREREGQTIVCEQAGASWLPFETFRTIKANESKHGKGTCDEVIWLNERVIAPAVTGAA